MKSATSLTQRIAPVLTMALFSLLLTDSALAQALEPVVHASDIARDTAVTVCAGILTVAWAVAGYKMTFQGAAFRDVSSLVLGGAISGAAAAIAKLFVG